MIIPLIFIVVSLSTIDADGFHPSLNTKQLNALHTRTNVRLPLAQLEYCSKLWNSVGNLPGSSQKIFIDLMSAILKGEEVFQNVVRRSMVYQIKVVPKRLRKNKNHKQENSKMTSEFIDSCMSEKFLELAPPALTRIRTKLLGIVDGSKHNLENNEPAFSETTPSSTDNEPEGEYNDDLGRTTEEPENIKDDGRVEIKDVAPLENANPVDNGEDEDDDDGKNGNNGNNDGENDKNGGNDEDDDNEPTNTPKKKSGFQVYVIKPGQLLNGIFDRRHNKFYKKAY